MPNPDKTAQELGSQTKDRSRFQQVLQECVRAVGIDVEGDVLIAGGSFEDARVLCAAGFRRMTLSNLQDVTAHELPQIDGVELKAVNADVENMAVPDGSYDVVLAHEVLHHCRSPHKALLEMLA